MLRGKLRLDRSTCEHTDSIAVSSSGMKRVICSDCGFVGFEASLELTSQVNRDMFAREIDPAPTH
ncbi:MAG: hypothetical protein R3258_03525 [Acidimicrobiia bacterium]|nr:hypothetical protein [Acidimicrobiia bacterium]